MPIKLTSPSSRRLALAKCGSSRLHGAHQEAKKFTTAGRPSRRSSETVSFASRTDGREKAAAAAALVARAYSRVPRAIAPAAATTTSAAITATDNARRLGAAAVGSSSSVSLTASGNGQLTLHRRGVDLAEEGVLAGLDGRHFVFHFLTGSGDDPAV